MQRDLEPRVGWWRVIVQDKTVRTTTLMSLDFLCRIG
jgi:hypothetical protein